MVLNNQKGFTLIEMMITLLISTIISLSTYTVFSSQQKVYAIQDQVVQMQQNLRAAFYLVTDDIQMAGYNPNPQSIVDFGITAALPGRISFTADDNLDDDDDTEDGNGSIDSGETIDIGLSPTFDSSGDGIPDQDSDLDGVPDAVDLGKQLSGAGGYQDIAENIQAVEFLYLDSGGANLAATLPGDLNAIRSVQVTILARAEQSDRKYVNSMIYTTPSGQNFGPYNDNFRRRLLTTTIKCRNLGM